MPYSHVASVHLGSILGYSPFCPLNSATETLRLSDISQSALMTSAYTMDVTWCGREMPSSQVANVHLFRSILGYSRVCPLIDRDTPVVGYLPECADDMRSHDRMRTPLSNHSLSSAVFPRPTSQLKYLEGAAVTHDSLTRLIRPTIYPWKGMSAWD